MTLDPKAPRKKRHTAEMIIAAIVGTAGIKTTIAKRLNVHRYTVDRYLARYPAVALAYKNEVDGIGDMVEATILEAIKNKDIETAKWYAKNKLKDRGYSERHEIVKEFRDMSDDQLVRFITERIGADLGSDPGSRTAPPDKAHTTLH